MSLGCIGNRVYTELAEDELYVVIRACDLEEVAAALIIITGANAAFASPSCRLTGNLSCRHSACSPYAFVKHRPPQ